MIDELDNEVLGLYRNWEEGDTTMTKLGRASCRERVLPTV